MDQIKIIRPWAEIYVFAVCCMTEKVIKVEHISHPLYNKGSLKTLNKNHNKITHVKIIDFFIGEINFTQ